MLAQLELDQYFIDKFTVETNPSFDGQEQYDSDLDVDFAIARATDGQPRFEVKLFIDLNKKKGPFSKAPYRIHLQVTGYYHFLEETEKDVINKLIAPNGLAILYGIARNSVSQMTGVGRFGRVLLPSVNLIEIIKGKAKKEQKALSD